MTPDDGQTFDDPRLKAAIRGAWGAERAPEALRARVAALAGTGAVGAGKVEASMPMRLVPTAPAPAPRRHRWKEALGAPVARYAMAAAAMVLIGFGLAYQLDRSRRPINPGPGTVAALPVSVTQGLVDRHEKCITLRDHHDLAGAPRDNFLLIGQKMQDRLGFRVLAEPLPRGHATTGPATQPLDDEWEFAGAAVCPVDSYPCSHLVYRRRGKNVSVSVFSLPRHSCANINGEWECEYHDPRHPMAGVIANGGVYCVIGSSPDGSLTLNDVRQIFEDLRRRTTLMPRRTTPLR